MIASALFEPSPALTIVDSELIDPHLGGGGGGGHSVPGSIRYPVQFILNLFLMGGFLPGNACQHAAQL